MKIKISVLLVCLAVLLAGCTDVFPLNQQNPAFSADVSVSDSDELFSDIAESSSKEEISSRVVTTVAETTSVTEKATEATSRETTTQEETTTEAEEPTTQKKVGIVEGIIEGITELSGLLSGKNNKHSIDPDKPLLALTFDDGPSAHTKRLLDILGQHGARATFFVTGNTIGRRADTVRRIVNEGHEIADHSWSHKNLTELSNEDISAELEKTNIKIYEITGVECKLARPPYGAYNDEVKQVGKDLGMAYILWSYDTLDWKTKDAQAVYDAVMAGAKDGRIILCHDLHKTTVDAMETVIPALIEEGYQLVTVSELLTARGGSIKAGNIYNKLK